MNRRKQSGPKVIPGPKTDFLISLLPVPRREMRKTRRIEGIFDLTEREGFHMANLGARKWQFCE